MNRGFFTDKRVLVMGLGRFGGGADMVRFACAAGAEVTVTDLASREMLGGLAEQLEALEGVRFHLGGHRLEDFERADVVVANPAVAFDNEFLQIARRGGKVVTSQINIFFELCPALVVGITGANGKSTTAALTAHLLRGRRAGKGRDYGRVWLSGNIGNEPLLAVLEQMGAGDVVVLELSSFQIQPLAGIGRASNVSVLTNLTPNHLDRHGSFARYCAAKENLFRLQKRRGDMPAVSVFNLEDEVGAEWFARYRADVDRVCIGFSTEDVSEEVRQRFSLPGRANLSNLAAAMAVARYFGVDEESVVASLPGFKPLAHRLELVCERGGVRWYNDSKSTTPESSIAALEAFKQTGVVILGGYDKNLAFGRLGRVIAERSKAAILLGQTADKIAGAIRAAGKSEVRVERADTLREAVQSAESMAENGEVVVLSPGCASYDMFENFEQRGREFCELVREIAG